MSRTVGIFRGPNGLYRLRSGGESVALLFADQATAAVNTVAPTMTLASGTAGKIGAAYDVDPGAWSGAPALSWAIYRDGAQIPGTEGATSYTLAPGDDRASVFARVTATVEGREPVVADSAAIAVTYAAPVAIGTISNVSVVQGSGITTRDATTAFSGSGIVWSISGPADITIDEGIVFVPSNVVQAGVTATVHATNSGGTADVAFTITITAGTPPAEGPDPIEEAEVTVTFELDPYAGTAGVPEGAATWMFEITSGPALSATRLWWRGAVADPAMVPGAGFHPCIPHPTILHKWIARAYTPGDLDTPRVRDWLWVNLPLVGDTHLGDTATEVLIYTTDALTTAVADATFSDFSDTLTQLCEISTGEEPVSVLSRRMPLRETAEKNAGTPPADGLQQWHDTDFALSDPDVIYGIQDTGAVWKSIDHGATWRLPARTGLASFQGLGVCVDPADPDHVLVNMGGSYAHTVDYQGIYESFDGCETFEPRILAGIADARRGTHKTMAFAPGSGTTGTRTSKAIVIAVGTPASATSLQFPIATTDDGGATWTTLATTWAQATYGTPSQMVGDASDDGRFYAVSGKGLIKITNAFTGTFTFTIMSGSGGLPSGSINGKPYVSADGNTIIVGLGGSKGIYKTTNGGTSWAQVGSHTNYTRLHVNPYDPTRMISTTNEGSSTQTPAYSQDSGATFIQVNKANVERRAGSESQNPNMIGNYQSVCWHDSDPDWAFMAGRETSPGHSNNMYRTEDLVNWSLAIEGFCGVNFAVRGQAPNLFDPSDHLRFILPLIDFGPRLTTDGGLSFTPKAFTHGAFSPALGELSSYGGAVHPSQDVVFSMTEDNPRLLRGTAGASSWVEIAGAANGHPCIFADPADDGTWFCGRKKSTDDGVTFTAMSGLPSDYSVCDRTLTGDAIWAHNYSGSCDSLYRSLDKGVTWSLALTMGYNNKIAGSKWGPLAAHPVNTAYVFTSHPTDGHVIRRWDVSSGTAGSRPSTDLNIFGGSVPASYTAECVIRALAIDPRFPLVMYALTWFSGDPRLYRSEDGGATWEALGADVIPQVFNANALVVSPVTGDVLVGGSNGTFVIPPPYAQATTIFGLSTVGNYLGEAA